MTAKQHQNRAGHDRSNYPAQQRQPGGQEEMEQRGHDHQARQESGTALRQRYLVCREVTGSGVDEDNVSGAESPESCSLQRGGGPVHYEGGEYGPRQVFFAQPRAAQRYRNNDGADGEHDHRPLKPRNEGDGERGRFVGFVYYVVVGSHRAEPYESPGGDGGWELGGTWEPLVRFSLYDVR